MSTHSMDKSHDWIYDHIQMLEQRVERLELKKELESKKCWCGGEHQLDFTPKYRDLTCGRCGHVWRATIKGQIHGVSHGEEQYCPQCCHLNFIVIYSPDSKVFQPKEDS